MHFALFSFFSYYSPIFFSISFSRYANEEEEEKEEGKPTSKNFFVKTKKNDYSSMTHKAQNKRAVFVCDKYKNANVKGTKRVRKDEG